jgi:mRNA interferase MazF
VALPKGSAELGEDSKVLLDQIRSVDKSRLERKIGKLSVEAMKKIDLAIHLSLGLVD